MYDNGDILLFTLSAQGETSWRNFKHCFDEIQRRSAATADYDPAENAAGHRWRALRELSALGHIDLRFNQNDIQVFAAPPALTSLPGIGNPQAILCGARSPDLVKRLETKSAALEVEMSVASQADASPYAPTRVGIRASDKAGIQSLASSVGIRYLEVPPARLLARVSISLAEYRSGLTWSSSPELNWRREDFDTERLQFRPAVEPASQRRLSRYQNPVTTVWQHRLWQGEQSAEVDLDWGRYAILAMTSRRVLWYDQKERKAVVPYGVPLPALLARAFGLCSGYCPATGEPAQPDHTGRHHEFGNVPVSVFNAVAGKLGQGAQRMR